MNELMDCRIFHIFHLIKDYFLNLLINYLFYFIISLAAVINEVILIENPANIFI